MILITVAQTFRGLGGVFEYFLLGLHLFLLLLLLAAPHLVVVIDVAALALALRIDRLLAGMDAVSGQRAPTVLMVAVVAHAHGVEGQIDVRACCDGALFAAEFPRRELLSIAYRRSWACQALLSRG